MSTEASSYRLAALALRHSTLKQCTGFVFPFSRSGSSARSGNFSGESSAAVCWEMMIFPEEALAINRDAVFTVSPITV
jgi:hypothetical protein